MNPMLVAALLEELSGWVSEQPDIEAAALVGSHARGTLSANSDVDLIILTSAPTKYFQDKSWVTKFGEVRECKVENWGRVESLRVFYRAGLEVEYGFALPDWASIPVEAETRRVISEGMRILFDPHAILVACLQSLRSD
jgi:predicted nucleotidyltransferase